MSVFQVCSCVCMSTLEEWSGLNDTEKYDGSTPAPTGGGSSR